MISQVARLLVLRRFLPVLGFSLLISCTSVSPHWLRKDKDGNYVPKGEPPAKNLRVVEFNELGDLWSRQQRDEAIRHIKATEKPPLVVTFVHGWRHSASAKDENLLGFKEFMNALQAANISNREVVGIYIGWRGASAVEFGVLNPLVYPSIYGRTDATDRLAGVPLGETFWRIKEAAAARGGTSILLGHSLGGRTIERCVGQYIVAANYRSAKAGKVERVLADGVPADLIVLINPASETLYAHQIKRALEGWGNRPPAIISVTADSDGATNGIWNKSKYILPSVWQQALFAEVQDPLDRKPHGFRETNASYLTRTAGHDDRIIDADVRAMDEDSKAFNSDGVKDVIGDNIEKGKKREWFWIASKDQPARRFYLEKHEARDDEEHKKWVYGRANGYWVLSVKSDILQGHTGGKDGIFNTPMTHLLSGLFSRSKSPLR